MAKNMINKQKRRDWFKIATTVAACSVTVGLFATTGVIAHQLVIANEIGLKINKVENLGELEKDSDHNVNTTFLRITFNKNINWVNSIDVDTSNEDLESTSETWFGSSSDIVYVNGNKVEIWMKGGFVAGGDQNHYTLDGPIKAKLELSIGGATFYCEVDWGLELYNWWDGNEEMPNISGQHVKNIHCTTENSRDDGR